MYTKQQTMRGMTLVEMLVAISIFSMIMMGVTVLFTSLWRLQGFTVRLGMSSQQATAAVTKITDLVRDARQADNGGYAVVSATPSELIVYTDYDRDDATERVRFFRDGAELRMGIVEPVATVPVTYNVATEAVTTIAKDVVDTADGTTLFVYYDAQNVTLSPMPAPEDVRMVRTTVTVDTDPAKPPEGVVVSSFASLRNLREW